MAKSTVDTLAADVEKVLEKYVDECGKITSEAVKTAGNKGKQALNSAAASKFGGRKYQKSWKVKLEKKRLYTVATLYSSMPGLPHLLEHGHAKRNGGRVEGREHIFPVEQELIKAFETELNNEL